MLQEIEKIREFHFVKKCKLGNEGCPLGLKDDEHFRKAYLLPALEAGLVEMAIPDKPRSSKQKYRLTDKGRQVMARHGGG
jgi:hypothetical protein